MLLLVLKSMRERECTVCCAPKQGKYAKICEPTRQETSKPQETRYRRSHWLSLEWHRIRRRRLTRHDVTWYQVYRHDRQTTLVGHIRLEVSLVHTIKRLIFLFIFLILMYRVFSLPRARHIWEKIPATWDALWMPNSSSRKVYNGQLGGLLFVPAPCFLFVCNSGVYFVWVHVLVLGLKIATDLSHSIYLWRLAL